MILVNTSVQIDHSHHSDPILISLLHEDGIESRPPVAKELAMGLLGSGDDVLKHLTHPRQFLVLSHDELLVPVVAHVLWGRGLSPIDTHLLDSVILVPGARLWTRDKWLLYAVEERGVSFTEGTVY